MYNKDPVHLQQQHHLDETRNLVRCLVIADYFDTVGTAKNGHHDATNLGAMSPV